MIVCKNEKEIGYLLRDKSNIIGKTIFIDRFDINYSRELIEFIETGPNRFIIVSNSQYRRLGINAESFIILSYLKDTSTFITEPYDYKKHGEELIS